MKTRIMVFILLLCNCVQAQNGWQAQVSNTDEHLYDVHFPDQYSGWVVGASGTILHTSDAGVQWWSQSAPSDKNLNAICFRNTSVGLAVGDNCTVIYTSDGGINWVPLDMDAAISGRIQDFTGSQTSSNDLNDLCFNSPNTGCIVGDNGLILMICQDGSICNIINPVVSKKLNRVGFCSEMRGWIVGEEGTILRTEDGGNTWSLIPTGSYNDLNAICFCSPGKGFIAGSGTVLITIDSGNTFQPLPGMPTNDYSFVCFPSPEVGYCATYNGEIYCSTDGGFTWTFQPTGIASPLNTLCFCKESSGWAAGNNGIVLHTTNGGWAGLNEDEIPEGMMVYPVPANDRLYIEFEKRGGVEILASVADMAGRIIIAPHKPGEINGRISIPIASLKPGVYRLIITGKKTISRSFTRIP